MGKKARVWDGTAWQELASAQTDLTAYSTTAQMNTAITAGVGLVPILTQTIGSAVSSVVVNNAFSATYDAYKITISGGSGTTEEALRMQLGASATGYYAGIGTVNYSGATTSNASDNNTTQWSRVGRFTANLINMNIDVLNPFLSKPTLYFGQYTAPNTGAGSGFASGFHNVSTSYTDFTLTPASGTLTGGTIRVYGYKN